jgi:hypothetical protein
MTPPTQDDAAHDARVAELLAANNAEVERRRRAEEELRLARAYADTLQRRLSQEAAGNDLRAEEVVALHRERDHWREKAQHYRWRVEYVETLNAELRKRPAERKSDDDCHPHPDDCKTCGERVTTMAVGQDVHLIYPCRGPTGAPGRHDCAWIVRPTPHATENGCGNG